LEALKERRESRQVHSPAALSRQRTRLQASPAAGDIIVNNDGFIGVSNQSQMVVARQPDGGTVAVWTDDRDANPSIYGQVFDSLGNPVGENFRLHPDPDNLTQVDPAIAVRSDGGFFGAFTQVNADGTEDVILQRFSGVGQRLGAGVVVDTAGGRQRRPQLAFLSGNEVLAVYEIDNVLGTNSDIAAQMMSDDGATQIGSRITISADLVVGGLRVTYDEREPVAGVHSGDTIWVAWTDDRDGGVRDLWAQRVVRPATDSLELFGSIFKVNDESVAANAAQKTPSIGVASDGSTLIAWSDFRNTEWDVYKQSYTSAATPIGNNSRVNFTDASGLDQGAPFVTWSDTLGILVWQDFRQGVARIYAQKYHSDGSAIGSNYLVSFPVAANQTGPSVSMAPTGEYSLGYAQPDSGFDAAYLRRFTAADSGDTPQTVAEIVISATQVLPSTAMGSGGETFTVWEESRAALPNIVGQALDISLNKPQPALQQNGGPDVLHLVPSTAVGGTIGFTVWEDYRDTIQPVYSDIFLARYTLTASGATAIGNNVRVIDTVESQDVRLASWNPEVAADANGNAMVVWQDNRFGSWDILSARYSDSVDGAGNPVRIGLNDRVDQAPAFTKQIWPRLDVNDVGQTVVVWEDTRTGSYNFEVWARLYTGAGASATGNEIKLDIDSTLTPRLADVAIAGDGSFAVVFEDHSNPADVEIYLQRFDATGARIAGALGDAILVNDDGIGALQFYVRVAAIAGGYVAVWQDERNGDWDVYKSLVADGQSTPNLNEIVNDPDASDQTLPSIAARRSENNPFICWEDLRVTATAPDIFGNRNPATIATSAGSETDRDVRPDGFELAQNYPNPFNPATSIQYTLSRATRVELVVFNTLGQKVKTLLATDQEPGAHLVSWDGTDDRGTSVASGAYFYRLVWSEGELTKKMTLLR